MRRRHILVGLAAAAAAALWSHPPAPRHSRRRAAVGGEGRLPVPVVRTIAVGSNPGDVVICQRLRQAFVLNDRQHLGREPGDEEADRRVRHRRRSTEQQPRARAQRHVGLRHELRAQGRHVVDLRSQKVNGHILIRGADHLGDDGAAGLGERAFVSMLFRACSSCRPRRRR